MSSQWIGLFAAQSCQVGSTSRDMTVEVESVMQISTRWNLRICVVNFEM